jgi:tRNA pseudouridine55 synthase
MIFTKDNIHNIEELIEKSNSEGVAILIDKPLKWTSFDIVAKLRGLLKIKKIGHAGTLDPLATGLLIICAGKYTKKINEFQDLYKEYSGKVKLGVTTKSYDTEFEEENFCDISHLTNEIIYDTANSFIGKQLQMPPMFSAKKVGGKKLYELARKNIEIERKPNEIEFIDVKVEYLAPFFDFHIKCSKGTYIRSFAYDFGAKLGVGAYLYSLRRTAIGDFKVEDSIDIKQLADTLKKYRENL